MFSQASVILSFSTLFHTYAWHGKGGHALQRGACVAGGMHGKGGMHGGGIFGRGACMVGGVHGRGSTWQERRPLQRTVRILLECILVAFVEIDNLVINLFTHF